MHNLVRALSAALTQQHMIPQNVVLTAITLSHLSTLTPEALLKLPEPMATKVAISARQSGLYYRATTTVNKTHVAELRFLEGADPLTRKLHFGPSTGPSQSKFTAQAIQRFVLEADDQNPIHTGDFPVVPGLMILDWLLPRLPEVVMTLSLKFRQPLFCDQGFNLVVLEDETHMAISQGDTVLVDIRLEA